MWEENLHFAKEFDDPEDPVRIAENMKLVKDQDKYVEYIRHVESKCDSLFLPFGDMFPRALFNRWLQILLRCETAQTAERD